MTSRLVDLARTYIVYNFFEGDSKDKSFFKEMKVIDVPTVIVFQGGKETKRFTGIVESAKIVKGVKTYKEQKEPWYKLW